ncbi:MAG: hypothetical protein ACK5EN_15240 [Planctomyces sp.]|jgi:hypothetical protein
MKKYAWSMLTASLLGLTLAGASLVSAQPPEGGDNPPPPREGQPPGGGRGPRPNPLAEALDRNRDGDISAEELKEAAASLQTLDSNKDGVISREEMRPPGRPPGGPEGEGRPPGPPPGGPEGGGPEGFVRHALSFDADGDGKLNRDELMKLAQSPPPRPGQGMRPGQGGGPPGGRGPGAGGPPGAGGRPGRPGAEGGGTPERPRRPSAE